MKKLAAAWGLPAAALVLSWVAAPAYADDSPRAVVASTEAAAPAAPLRWSVEGAIGPIAPILPLQWEGRTPVTAWQLQVLRRRDDERIIFGGALEGTYGALTGVGPQLLGVHAFVGRGWRYRLVTFEATIGVGLEAAEVSVFYDTGQVGNGAPSGFYETYHLGFYGQGALTAALPVSDAIDLGLQIALHLTAPHEENWFGAGMIGVRYTLP